ncbi:beta propeller repeat protein [Anaeromicropila herbilytica]|uniref:Xyloglucanase n=1 Tax=Anaeromicropila herbilytica TaxID=2785025 RepID=A0A7R7EQV3_9FIRM|nr:endoglucanase [Anaeromicropila herbilytica]BCN32837.1 xyloglucanase [Anaeromicropila herbilytica]
MNNSNSNITKQIPYTYRNLPVPGGGFVTGFSFHKNAKDILYARTDIGGVYRYDFANDTWVSLMDHVTNLNLSESYPLAIALDPKNEDSLYIACGDHKTGTLCISYDRGNHFIYRSIPCPVHGNSPGRGTGDRLMLDPNNSRVIYFASQTRGLLRSMDEGMTWEFLTVCEDKEKEQNEYDLTCLFIDSRRTSTITSGMNNNNTNNNSNTNETALSTTLIVSTSGVVNRTNDLTRGHCLYISTDCGNTFHKLAQPAHIASSNRISGLVAQRMDYDGTYLYVTMAASGEPNYSFFSNYSCDSGSSFDGRLLRYQMGDDGKILDYVDITPDTGRKQNEYGLSGISSNRDIPGLLLCTTICRKDSDIIFLSKDYGSSWEEILCGTAIGNIDFNVPYMKPEYNGNASIIHWMSDIKINPYDMNHAVFNTGTGIFMTDNLLDSSPTWYPSCRGLEETVHLNIYSPPSGDVKLIDILGDLGGFAFTDLDTPPENTFADEQRNRYITCMNADYPDCNPNIVVATPRGNWTGKTIGGLILSKDQCKTFKRLSHPYGLSSYIDTLLDRIKLPNINSGWCAISSDSSSLLWTIADGNRLPLTGAVLTCDEGDTWEKVLIYNTKNNLIQDSNTQLKIMADRVNPSIFYGFGENSRIYVSRDYGKTFYEHEVPSCFPIHNLGSLDGSHHVEIRVESGKEGVIWIALNYNGLWKLVYHADTNTFKYHKITKEGESVFAQGMGLGKDTKVKTLYICGEIEGIYGFYRSFNEGNTWERINTTNQMYGDVKCIIGDPRVFGRFYIATGSRGVLYGEEIVYHN